MSRKEIEKIKKYVRAANYISAIQLYLKDNFLLERELSQDDIKPRLLGHWGTCPGINFVYANLQSFIKRTGAEMLFVLGPGHGFPALQANLFMEGTLGKYYKDIKQNESGLGIVARNFSWPYGFPSHSNPGAPGVILEGGELGYSLSTSFGAILDNPEQIIACLIGDGEAETGPMATSWHLSKFLNPKNDGAVLPILHLNGYKISGPSVYGRMTNRELKTLFYGYGYKPYVVEGDGHRVYKTMAKTLDACYGDLKNIKNDGRAVSGNSFPRYPMIILRTPKGWTGIKTLKGQKIEGNCLSHQVVGMSAKTDLEEFNAVKSWFASYKFNELFDKENGFIDDIKDIIPTPDLRMGDNRHAFGIKKMSKEISKELLLPDPKKFMEDATVPGTIGSSSMIRFGLYLKEVFKLNELRNNFRLMSPDETYSNKLNAVFEATPRVFAGPIEKWDMDLAPEGRVMEMLSEHSLQGLLQGYVLTGRYGIFASYEAFIHIVASMADQFAKFLKVAKETIWRGDIPSFNYILTSSGWRQEHNGFSHQNPGFIDSILQKHGSFVKAYFPPDANTALLVLAKCLSSKNGINVIVAGKTVEPRWLTPELAEKELRDGLMIWDFASEPDPDIVFSSAGEYLTKEALSAIELLKKEAPNIKARFVSLLEINASGIGSGEEALSDADFAKYFTADKPVIFNFHGYPETLKQTIFDYDNIGDRFSVHGYTEHGSTTTPFDLHLRNGTSRYDLMLKALEMLSKRGVIEGDRVRSIAEMYKRKIAEHKNYIIKHGEDPDEIEKWQWKKNI